MFFSDFFERRRRVTSGGPHVSRAGNVPSESALSSWVGGAEHILGSMGEEKRKKHSKSWCTWMSPYLEDHPS